MTANLDVSVICKHSMQARGCHRETCRFAHDEKICKDFYGGKCADAKDGAKCKAGNHFVTLPEGFEAGKNTKADGEKKAPREKKERKPKAEKAPKADAAAEDGEEKPQRKNLSHQEKRERREAKIAEAAARGEEPRAPKEKKERKPKSEIAEAAAAPAAEEKADKKNKKKKNTETFVPSHQAAAIRVVVDTNNKKASVAVESRDVSFYPNLFSKSTDQKLYETIKAELADKEGDRAAVKDVADRVAAFFGMDVRATRANSYQPGKAWNNFKQDAAASKNDSADKPLNFTVVVSFGAKRDVAFVDSKSETVIAVPVGDCATYAFAHGIKDAWSHGTLPSAKKDDAADEGRVSVIVWGSVKQTVVATAAVPAAATDAEAKKGPARRRRAPRTVKKE